MCSQQATKAKSTPQYLRVFLSSPGDVADERTLARRLLKEELPYDPFLRGRVAIDVVSWDDQAAPVPMLATLTPQEAINRCDKPSDCDIVVVILWSRMGTPLPPEYRKPTGELYLSGTEWEYEDACSARPPPDILVYRRTEEPLLKLTDSAWEEKRRQYGLAEQFFARFRHPDGSLCGGVTEYATPAGFKERLAKDLRHIIHKRLGERDPRLVAPVEPLWTGSPYPGLRAFTSKEAAIFFGRGGETDALIARLRNPDQRFLMVVGASGSGKSSLVQAGLLPRLQGGAIEGSQDWCVLTFTPSATGDNPFLALAVELVRKLLPSEYKPPVEIAEALATTPERITAYVDWLQTGTVLVLFVDQLEELFTQVAEIHRAAFVALLTHATGDPRLRVLATLRADFYPQAIAEPKLAVLLQRSAGAFPLGPPEPTALAEIIRKPAERAGLDLEDRLIDEIWKDAGSDPGVLPLVAFCLQTLYQQTLYQQSAPTRRLTVKAYEDLGRLHGAIGRHTNVLLDELRGTEGAAPDTDLPQLFHTLVYVDPTGTPTRRRVLWDELGTEPRIRRLVKVLIKERLLSAENGRPEDFYATVAVASDVLFKAWPVLNTWLDRNRTDLMLYAEIAANMARWQRESQDDNLLLPKGKRLDEAVALANRRPELLKLDSAMKKFIQASLAQEWERLYRESLRLAALAEQETAAGNATNGILLALKALEPLPRNFAHPECPYVPQAKTALQVAIFAHREKQILRGHEGPVNAAAFSPDGRLVVTASADGTARLWGAVTGQELAVLRGHWEPVNTAAFSPDGALVITGSADGTARLWDPNSGQERVVLRGHEGPVNAAAFSPDGRLVVTASADGTARLWGAVTGQELAVLRGHRGPVNAVTFSPDGALVVTASADRTVRLWDAKDKQEKVVLSGHERAVWSAAFSPDGALVVTGSNDRTTRVWNAASGQPVTVLRGHADWVRSAAFSPNGALVVTASADGTARLWDINIASEQERVVLRGHEGPVNAAAFSPDGRLVITASADGTARLWDATIRGGQLHAVLRGHMGPVNTAAFSPDGRLVVTASADRTVRLWDAVGGQPLADLRGHEGVVHCAAVSADGRRIITGSADSTVRLWDSPNGQEFAVLRGHTRAVVAVAFSADGRYVVTASGDYTARLWDSPNGQELAVLRGHTGAVVAVAFSADGQQRMITTSDDGTARLWGAVTGQELAVLSGHEGPVNTAAFSPDGALVVTGSADGTARLWDAVGGQLRAVLSGHEGPVNTAAFSPDGALVVTGSADGTARLWDAVGGQLRAVLRGHREPVNAAAFSPDGALVVTASADNSARLWETMFSQKLVRPTFKDTQELINYARSIVPRQLTVEQRQNFAIL